MISYGKRVLVVDDDERERQETALVLDQAGFTVVQVCDGLDALNEMQKRRFDVVVTDCHMPHLNGLDFLAQSRVIWPNIPVIIFSETRYMSEMAASRGAFGWICKSSDPSALLSMLAVAVEQGVGWESTHAVQRVGA